MASEYLKWKARDVEHEAPRTLSRKEKRQNWWAYHKWHVVFALALLLILWDIGRSVLGFGQVKPDYQIAYVGTQALPEDAATALEAGFAGFGQDLNGDGKVTVRINQFVFSGSADASYAYASQTALLADLESCDSFLFLLENPEEFQQTYHVLSKIDGSLPEEGDDSARGTYLHWEQCPALEQLTLEGDSLSQSGQEMTGHRLDQISGLSIARRGFWTEKTVSHLEGCEELWNAIIKGAHV